MIKKSFFTSLLVAITLISAQASDFALQASEDSLKVMSKTGDKVAEVTQGTVGKQITIDGTQFMLSFGRDVRNNLSAILSPVMDKNSPLNFTALNKSVKTDGNAIVTVSYSKDLSSVEIDPGFIGRVKVAELGVASSSSKSVASSKSEEVKSAPVAKTAPDKKADEKPEVTANSIESLDREMASQGSVNQTEKANSDAIALLKNEGVKGLFDGKNAAYELKDYTAQQSFKDKNSPLSTASITNPSVSKPVGKMSSIAPEKLASTAQDKPGDVRLFNIDGKVTVNGQTAKEGDVIAAQALIKTEANSGVVAVIGGLHLVTLHPETEISVSQMLDNKTMHTVVNLKEGNVFSDVNKRDGMKQDFQIVTENGSSSATGSQSLVCKKGNQTITIAFESSWKGKDSSGKQIFNMGPMVATDANKTRAVSFSSIPAMSGAEMSKAISQILAQVRENVTSNPSRNQNAVTHPVASFVQGNCPSLPDGRTNPGATLEGKLRSLVASLITDGFTPEKKDDGWDLNLVGDGPLKKNDFEKDFDNGKNGKVQPGETTPGGV